MVDHSFSLQAIMEMQKSLGSLNTAVSGLTRIIEKHDTKLDNISALAVEIRTLKETVEKQGTKLDGVRQWVTRAGAIIGACIAIAGILIKFWPNH